MNTKFQNGKKINRFFLKLIIPFSLIIFANSSKGLFISKTLSKFQSSEKPTKAENMLKLERAGKKVHLEKPNQVFSNERPSIKIDNEKNSISSQIPKYPIPENIDLNNLTQPVLEQMNQNKVNGNPILKGIVFNLISENPKYVDRETTHKLLNPIKSCPDFIKCEFLKPGLAKIIFTPNFDSENFESIMIKLGLNSELKDEYYSVSKE